MASGVILIIVFIHPEDIKPNAVSLLEQFGHCGQNTVTHNVEITLCSSVDRL